MVTIQVMMTLPQRMQRADELPATSMLALVRFYVNALTDAERGNRPEYRYGDMSNTHKSLPFAMVHVDPNLQARYGLNRH